MVVAAGDRGPEACGIERHCLGSEQCRRGSQSRVQHVVRTRERPRSIYRSDIVMDGLSLEIGTTAPAGGIPYPEWDYRKQRHLPAWYHVQPELLTQADPAWAQATATRHRSVNLDLRKKLAARAT